MFICIVHVHNLLKKTWSNFKLFEFLENISLIRWNGGSIRLSHFRDIFPPGHVKKAIILGTH